MVSFIVYISILSVCVAMIFTTKSLTASPLKIIIMLLLLHGYLTTWATYKQVSGYPTESDVPEKFEILWGRAVELPGEEKFIVIWITYDTPMVDKLISMFSLAHDWKNISRVYRLPYNQENHQTVMEIQKKIEMGIKVGVLKGSAAIDDDIDLRESIQRYQIEYDSKRISK